MNPIGILHINTERGWRGGERQTLWLAQELSRRGHTNTVACRPGEPLAEAAGRAGVPVLPIHPVVEFDIFSARKIRSRLRAQPPVSIVHAHTGHAVGLGALAVRGTGKPFVATRRVDFPLGRFLGSRWKYGRVDGFAAISSAVAAQAVDGGVPREKIVVIPSGIDPSGYPRVQDRESLRQKHGFSGEDLLIVTVGALVPHKDHATFLRAARRVSDSYPQATFLIVGEGPLRPSLESLSREMGLGDRILFLGHRPEVLEYTAMADLFVFSSAEEGLGTALLDALVIGVPTAATAAGGIPDIYGGKDARELTPPGDADALAANMCSVLGNPEERARRLERGRTRGLLFSVTAMAEAYEKLYEHVIQLKPAMKDS